MAHNKWLEEEKEFVRQHFKDMDDIELHEHLPNHSVDSIATWRRRNGCHYDNPFGKIYTFNDVINYMDKYGYELISDETEFQNALSKIRYKCNIHNDVVQTTTMAHLKEGKKCRLCGIETTAAKKRISLDKYIDKDRMRCDELDFEYIDTIRDKSVGGEKKIYIRFICNKHKNAGIQKMPRYNMYRDIKGCEYCAHKKFLDGELEMLCAQGSPHINIITKPVFQINQRVDCVCNKHGKLSNIRIGDIIAGKSCAKCGIEKLSAQNFLKADEVKAIVLATHPDATLISEYCGCKTPVSLKCNKCGFEYPAYIHLRKQCPNCEKYYYGEKLVQNYLEYKNINNIMQHKLDDCRNKNRLPFDFYLPDLNICIEYQGKQHYEPVEMFGGIEGFTQQQHNDKIKKEYCSLNGIKLIEVSYVYNTASAVEKYLDSVI